MESNLPQNPPLGLFLDVYLFLERVLSYCSDEDESTVTEDMDILGKVRLTVSESVAINAHKKYIPRAMQIGASDASSVRSSLPGLPTKAH